MSLNRGRVFLKSACAVVAGYGLRNGRKAEKKDGVPNVSFKPVVRNEMEDGYTESSVINHLP